MSDLTDKQLIEDYLAGDEQSFAVLLNRYLSLVVNFANTFVKDRQTAEDIAQDVFLKVWKNLKKYKPESNFKTWLLVIAKNTSFDYLRKHKINPSGILSFHDYQNEGELEIADSASLPDEIMFKKELQETLNGVLAGFSEAEKLIVALHYYEQLTLEEIGQILNESTNTVKSRHRRLLIKLRQILA